MELSTELFRFWNSISSWGFRFEGTKMWCGFISLDQFRFKGRVIEGTQTLDLFSMAGGFFRIKSVLGRPGKTDWIERRCLYLFFIDRIPIIFSLRRRRQGRGTEHVLSSTSIRRFINPLFLFTSTLRATTSSPLTSQGKS